MRAWLRAAVDAWHRPLPPERLGWIRVLVLGYSLLYVLLQWRMFLEAANFPAEEYRAVGIFSLFDVRLSDGALRALLLTFAGTGAMAVAGWRFTLTGPAFAIVNLVLLSYRNSWGYIQHGEKLAVLHVLILACSRSAAAISVDASSRDRAAEWRPDSYGWPVRLMALVTALTYVIAAVTKLRSSGVEWVTADIVRNAVSWVALRNELLGLPASPVAPLLLQLPLIFNVLAAVTLIVELSAPLAFVGRFRIPWIVSALAMHWGILVLMLIPFPYHLLGFAFLPLLPVERWFARMAVWSPRAAHVPSCH